MESLKNADFDVHVREVASTEGFNGDVTVKWEHAEDYLESLESKAKYRADYGEDAYIELCQKSLKELYKHDCIHVTPDPDAWVEKNPWTADDNADDVKNKLNYAVDDSQILGIKLTDYLDYSKYIQSQPIPDDIKKNVVFINKDNECVYKDGKKFDSCDVDDVREVLKELKGSKITASEKFAQKCNTPEETAVKQKGRRI